MGNRVSRKRCNNSLHLRKQLTCNLTWYTPIFQGCLILCPPSFVSVSLNYRVPIGLAGKQFQWAHSGNNSQSICALDRHADSFKYCPQPLLYSSVCIIICISPLLCSLDLPVLPAMTIFTFVFYFTLSLICVFSASLLHLQIIIRPILPFISPHFPHTVAIYLFIQSTESSGVGCQDARKHRFTYLCLWPLAIMSKLRRSAQQGLCQCRKLVCHQDAWMHTLTEYWMNMCRVTCIIHAESSVFCMFCTFLCTVWGPDVFMPSTSTMVCWDVLLRFSPSVFYVHVELAE